MKFFRQFRMRYLKEGKISAYLRYALGEIILVVIGILVAVSLNNWNQSRKQQSSFVEVIQTLREDIKKDTAEAGGILRIYKERYPIYANVVKGNTTEKMYNDSASKYHLLIAGYVPFTINTRGYELVKGNKEFVNKENKDLVVAISQIYSRQIESNKRNFEVIKNDIESNMTEWKNEKLWFSDAMQGNLTADYFEYVLNDPIYKNKVVYHSILVYNNYMQQLISFNEEMSQLLKETEKFQD